MLWLVSGILLDGAFPYHSIFIRQSLNAQFDVLYALGDLFQLFFGKGVDILQFLYGLAGTGDVGQAFLEVLLQ